MIGWLYYAAVQLVALVLMVIGWVVLIPLAFARCWEVRQSRHYSYRVSAWRGGWLTYWFGNEENGLFGDTRFQIEQRWLPVEDWPRLAAYQWCAVRNSASNFRWLVSWRDGPYYRWISRGGKWYFHAGFRPDKHWPVISAGRLLHEFDY